MANKLKDLTGQKFGWLTALYRLHNYHKKGNSYWLCVCDCGNIAEVRCTSLTSGVTKSCGCGKRYYSHGKTNTRLYRIFQAMKNRCYNKHTINYKHYGGRGVTVCDEWRNDFQAFYNWAINNGYRENLTIDRIDNNKGYSPDNCRFVDRKTQARNRHNIKQYTINGETHCLSEWCEILGLKFDKVRNRVYNYGWNIERALDLEVK